MAVTLALLAPLAGWSLGLVIGRLIFGEWLWQTSAKSRRNTKSSRSSSRQSSRGRQKPQRKARTVNSSRRGHSVCSCSNCLLGLTCLRSKQGTQLFHCGDPQCDLCPGQASLIDFASAAERLRELTAKRAAEDAERERERQKKYTEHISSLEKVDGAIRMFRTWRLYADGSLRAMTQQHTWKAGENVTLANGGDASADSGFYGFNSLEELKRQEEDWWEWSQSGVPEMQNKADLWGYPIRGGKGEPAWWYVCGSILAYGHVKVSAQGGRCQKAVPEYIIEPAGADPDFGMLVVNAADKYGMKIISVEDAHEIKTGVVPYWKGRPVE